jgi:hypothetical protein
MDQHCERCKHLDKTVTLYWCLIPYQGPYTRLLCACCCLQLRQASVHGMTCQYTVVLLLVGLVSDGLPIRKVLKPALDPSRVQQLDWHITGDQAWDCMSGTVQESL